VDEQNKTCTKGLGRLIVERRDRWLAEAARQAVQSGYG
jgi:hypothetical protein